MGKKPLLPDFVLADIERVAREIGDQYKADPRRAFGLPAKEAEPTRGEGDDAGSSSRPPVGPA